MRYLILIISIIFIFCSGRFVLARDITESAMPDWLDKIYQGIEQKVINPVKQSTQNLPQKAENTLKQLLEKIQQKKQTKQEEIKQEIKEEVKEEVKEWGQGGANWFKDQLAPLKNKIQQGSALIREGVNKIKDFLIDLFKE